MTPLNVDAFRAKYPEVSTIYIDEGQNVPPIAHASLIQLVNSRCVISLDSEQCLLSSPYLENCLKELFHKETVERHSEKLTEIVLNETYRSRPEIIEVVNHILDCKHNLDNNTNRRAYGNMVSLREKGGEVGWVDDLKSLQALAASADTVVIVENVTSKDISRINAEIRTNNILSAEQAIGLQFKM